LAGGEGSGEPGWEAGDAEGRCAGKWQDTSTGRAFHGQVADT
jgi:hypothetical protein